MATLDDFKVCLKNAQVSDVTRALNEMTPGATWTGIRSKKALLNIMESEPKRLRSLNIWTLNGKMLAFALQRAADRQRRELALAADKTARDLAYAARNRVRATAVDYQHRGSVNAENLAFVMKWVLEQTE